jgi:hypothetical protein
MPHTTDRDPLVDALRSAFREDSSTAPETSTCPSLERLAEIGSGETPSKVEESHLANCAPCTAEIALAAAFYRDEPTAGAHSEEIERIVEVLDAKHSNQAPGQPIAGTLTFPGSADRRNQKAPSADGATPGRRYRGVYRWAAAAMLLMTAGLITWRVSPRAPVLPPLPDVDISRGGEITLLPVAPGALGWSALDWQPVDGAEYYVVELQRIDGESLWSHRVDSDTTVVPIEVRDGIAPGVRWRWRVRGFAADGDEIAVSAWASRLRPLLD